MVGGFYGYHGIDWSRIWQQIDNGFSNPCPILVQSMINVNTSIISQLNGNITVYVLHESYEGWLKQNVGIKRNWDLKRPTGFTLMGCLMAGCFGLLDSQKISLSSIFMNELDDGKIYRKPLYSMVKTMVSCRFSLKPIHWLYHPRHVFFWGTPCHVVPRSLTRRRGFLLNRTSMRSWGNLHRNWPWRLVWKS